MTDVVASSTNGDSCSILCHQSTVGRQVSQVRDPLDHHGGTETPWVHSGDPEPSSNLTNFLNRQDAQLTYVANSGTLWVLLHNSDSSDKERSMNDSDKCQEGEYSSQILITWNMIPELDLRGILLLGLHM
jgi:hypothetical protein